MPDSDSSSRHETGDTPGYVVVARRYRPRGFDELVGQEHIGRALKNAIETQRVGHAYLFTGARGVGKTSTARIFAKALNDPSGPTVTPDNSSDIAQAIDAGEDVDVIEIDGASNRGIDEIRSLRANVGVRPSRSRFKIYIIDEVHMLTPAAFNALLKTLEEPPEHVKFIFCTTDPEKIPITVLSRCQRFDFAPVDVEKIVGRLREIVALESAEADDAALDLIARRAAGSMRDSQSLLEQVLSFSDGKLTVDQVHAMLGTADEERLHTLARAMANRDAAETLRLLDVAIDEGVDAGRLAEQLLGYFRDLMAVTVGCDSSLLRHSAASMMDDLAELGQQWGLQTVLAVVGMLDQTLVRVRYSVYARVLLEATLIQICNLPNLQNIADLAAAANSSLGQSSAGNPRRSETANAGVAAATREKKKPAVVARLASSSPTEVPQSVEPGSRPVRSAANADGGGDAAIDRPSQDIGSDSVAVTLDPAVSTVTAPTPAAARPITQSSVTQSSVTTQSSVPELGRAVSELDGQAHEVEDWDQSSAERVWQQTLGRLESMTETIARMVQCVQAADNESLRLVFPSDGDLAMKRCQLPEHSKTLADQVSQFAGRPIRLEYELAQRSAEPATAQPKANKPTRQQRMREIEAHPLISSCVELFDAEIVRIDKPK